MNRDDLIRIARDIPYKERIARIWRYGETDLHKYLERLYSLLESGEQVYITHGTTEFGKDLVIIHQNKLITYTVGVVVKKGDVKGKTAGDVDEIKSKVQALLNLSKTAIAEIISQIEQSIEHSAEIPFSVDTFKIDRIILVVAGEINANARKRFSEVTNLGVTFQDINWLVDNFTEYYPEIFFQTELLDFISSRIRVIENDHWLSKKKLNYSDYYVDPMITKFSFTREIDDSTIPDMMNKNHMNFNEIKEIIHKRQHVIIIGEPGTGKTGVLNKLSLDYLSKATSELVSNVDAELVFPLYLRASEIADISELDGVIELIPEAIRKRTKINALFIDALDELHNDKRANVLQKANDFATSLNCSLIVTSRNISCIHSIGNGYEKYELLPFDLQQAVALFRKLYKGDDTKIDALKHVFDDIFHQINIPPLSLHILIDLVEDNHEIPASITELYQRFFDMIFGRWDKDKGLSVVFDYSVINSYLSELAYKMFFEKGNIEIVLDEFSEFNQEYCQRKAYTDEKFKEFIEVVERSGVLRIDDQVYFGHRTFLDYFTAQHIIGNKESFPELFNSLKLIYFDDVWSDVTFYYVGFEHELKEGLINAILSHEGDSLSERLSKLMLGRLLQAGWNSDRSIKERTILEAIKYAPLCKTTFDKLTEKAKYDKIYNDFLILLLSEVSFGSYVLQSVVSDIIDRNLKNMTVDNAYETITLLWAVKRHLDNQQTSLYVGQVQESLKTLEMDKEQYVNMLQFLKVISANDEKAQKRIVDQLVEIHRSNKAINRKFIANLDKKRR